MQSVVAYTSNWVEKYNLKIALLVSTTETEAIIQYTGIPLETYGLSNTCR